jgi:hypothetical protein
MSSQTKLIGRLFQPDTRLVQSQSCRKFSVIQVLEREKSLQSQINSVSQYSKHSKKLWISIALRRMSITGSHSKICYPSQKKFLRLPINHQRRIKSMKSLIWTRMLNLETVRRIQRPQKWEIEISARRTHSRIWDPKVAVIFFHLGHMHGL